MEISRFEKVLDGIRSRGDKAALNGTDFLRDWWVKLGREYQRELRREKEEWKNIAKQIDDKNHINNS